MPSVQHLLQSFDKCYLLQPLLERSGFSGVFPFVTVCTFSYQISKMVVQLGQSKFRIRFTTIAGLAISCFCNGLSAASAKILGKAT